MAGTDPSATVKTGHQISGGRLTWRVLRSVRPRSNHRGRRVRRTSKLPRSISRMSAWNNSLLIMQPRTVSTCCRAWNTNRRRVCKPTDRACANQQGCTGGLRPRHAAAFSPAGSPHQADPGSSAARSRPSIQFQRRRYHPAQFYPRPEHRTPVRSGTAQRLSAIPPTILGEVRRISGGV